VMRGRDRGGEAPLLLALGSILVAPVLISYATSPIVWHGQRYLIMAVPILLALVCGAWEERWLKPAVAATLVSMLVCGGIYLDEFYRYRQKLPWDDAAALVDEQAKPSDAVVVIPSWLSGLAKRYMKRPHPMIPDEALDEPGAPARVWILALGDLGAEVESKTAYRVLGVRELTAHGPGGLFLHEMVRSVPP